MQHLFDTGSDYKLLLKEGDIYPLEKIAKNVEGIAPHDVPLSYPDKSLSTVVIDDLEFLLSMLQGQYQYGGATLLENDILQADPPQDVKARKVLVESQDLFKNKELLCVKETLNNGKCLIIVYDQELTPDNERYKYNEKFLESMLFNHNGRVPLFKTEYGIFVNGATYEILVKEWKKIEGSKENIYQIKLSVDGKETPWHYRAIDNTGATKYIPAFGETFLENPEGFSFEIHPNT